ncbi:AraC family transcriptional regulator [Verrucomicrobiaceae bacterium 227]
MNYPYGILILILGGFGTFTCGDQKWDLERGALLWASPGLTTEVILSEGSPPLTHFVIMPFGSLVEELFLKSMGSAVGVSQVSNMDAVSRLFEVILDEGVGRSPYREENCRALVKVLIHRLEGALLTNPRKLPNHSRETFDRARLHIQMNFATTRDLGDVAQAVGVSNPYLCRLFERYSDQSAFDFLTRLKLSKAARLLCSSDLSMQAISEQVGYSNLSIFSRNFRKRYRISPSYYRGANLKKSKKDQPE